jgi:hypothetical protein
VAVAQPAKGSDQNAMPRVVPSQLNECVRVKEECQAKIQQVRMRKFSSASLENSAGVHAKI